MLWLVFDFGIVDAKHLDKNISSWFIVFKNLNFYHIVCLTIFVCFFKHEYFVLYFVKSVYKELFIVFSFFNKLKISRVLLEHLYLSLFNLI